MKRRLLALLLTLCMATSLIPFSALAVEEPEDQNQVEATQTDASQEGTSQDGAPQEDAAPPDSPKDGASQEDAGPADPSQDGADPEDPAPAEEEDPSPAEAPPADEPSVFLQDALTAPTLTVAQEGADLVVTADAGAEYQEGYTVGIQYAVDSPQGITTSVESVSQTYVRHISEEYGTSMSTTYYCRGYMCDPEKVEYAYSAWKEASLDLSKAVELTPGTPVTVTEGGLYVLNADKDGVYQLTLGGSDCYGDLENENWNELRYFSGTDPLTQLLEKGPHYYAVFNLNNYDAENPATVTASFLQDMTVFKEPTAAMTAVDGFSATISATASVPPASDYSLGAQYGELKDDTDRKPVIDSRFVYDVKDLSEQDAGILAKGDWTVPVTPGVTYAYRAYLTDTEGEYFYSEWQAYSAPDNIDVLALNKNKTFTPTETEKTWYFALDAGKGGGFYEITAGPGPGSVTRWNADSLTWDTWYGEFSAGADGSGRFYLEPGKSWFRVTADGDEAITVKAVKLTSATELPVPTLTARDNKDFSVTFTASVSRVPLEGRTVLGFEYGPSKEDASVRTVVRLTAGEMKDSATESETVPAKPGVRLYARAFLNDEVNNAFTYGEWITVTPTAAIADLNPGDTATLTKETTYFKITTEELSLLDLTAAGDKVAFALWGIDWSGDTSVADGAFGRFLCGPGTDYLRVTRDMSMETPPTVTVSLASAPLVDEITVDSVSHQMNDYMSSAQITIAARIPMEGSFGAWVELDRYGVEQIDQESVVNQVSDYTNLVYSAKVTLSDPGLYDQYRVVFKDLDTGKEYQSAWTSFGFQPLTLGQAQTLTGDGWYRVDTDGKAGLYTLTNTGENSLTLWGRNNGGSSSNLPSSKTVYAGNSATWLCVGGNLLLHVKAASETAFTLTCQNDAAEGFAAQCTGWEPMLQSNSSTGNVGVQLNLEATVPLGSNYTLGVEYGRTREGATRKNVTSASGAQQELVSAKTWIPVYQDAPVVYRAYVLEQNERYYNDDWQTLTRADVMQSLTVGGTTTLTFPAGRTTVIGMAEITGEDSYSLSWSGVDGVNVSRWCKDSNSVSTYWNNDLLEAGTYYFQFTRTDAAAAADLTVSLDKPQALTVGTPVTMKNVPANTRLYYTLTTDARSACTYAWESNSRSVYWWDGDSWVYWSSGNLLVLDAGQHTFYIDSGYSGLDDTGVTLTVSKITPAKTLSLSGANALTGLDGTVYATMTVGTGDWGDYSYSWTGKPDGGNNPSVSYCRLTGEGTASWTSWSAKSDYYDNAKTLYAGEYLFRFTNGSAGDYSMTFATEEVTQPLTLGQAKTFQAESYKYCYFSVALDTAGDYRFSISGAGSGYLYFPENTSLYFYSGGESVTRHYDAGTVKLRIYPYYTGDYTIKVEKAEPLTGLVAQAELNPSDPFSVKVTVSAPEKEGVSYYYLGAQWSEDGGATTLIDFSSYTSPNDGVLSRSFNSSDSYYSSLHPGSTVYYRGYEEMESYTGGYTTETVYTDWQKIDLPLPAGATPLTLGQEKTVDCGKYSSFWFTLDTKAGKTYEVSASGSSGSLTRDNENYVSVKPEGSTMRWTADRDGVTLLELKAYAGQYVIKAAEAAEITQPVITGISVDGTGLYRTVTVTGETPSDGYWNAYLEYTPKGEEKTPEIQISYNSMKGLFDWDFNITLAPGAEYVCRAYLADANKYYYDTVPEADRIYYAGGDENHWIAVSAAQADYTAMVNDPRVEVFLDGGALVSFDAGEGGVYQVIAEESQSGEPIQVDAWDASLNNWVTMESNGTRGVRFPFGPGTAWLRLNGSGDAAFQLTRIDPEEGTEFFTKPTLTVEPGRDYSVFLTLSAIVPLESSYELGYQRADGTKCTIEDEYTDSLYDRTDIGAMYQRITAMPDRIYMMPGQTETFTPYLYDWQEQVYIFGEPVTVSAPDEAGLLDLTLGQTTYAVSLNESEFTYLRYAVAKGGSYLLNLNAPNCGGTIEVLDPETGDWEKLGPYNGYDFIFGQLNKLFDRSKGQEILLRVKLGNWPDDGGAMAVTVTKAAAPAFRAALTLGENSPMQCEYTVTALAPVGSSYELGLVGGPAKEDAYKLDCLSVTMSDDPGVNLSSCFYTYPGQTWWLRPYVYDTDRETFTYGAWTQYTAPEVETVLTPGTAATFTAPTDYSMLYAAFTAPTDGYYRITFNGPEDSMFWLMDDPFNSNRSYPGGEEVSIVRPMGEGELYYLELFMITGGTTATLKVEQITSTVKDYGKFTLSMADTSTPFRMDLLVTGKVPQGARFAYGVEYYLDGCVDDNGNPETNRLQIFSTMDDSIYSSTGYPRDTVRGSAWINLLPGDKIHARLFLYDWDLEAYLPVGDGQWQTFTNAKTPAVLPLDKDTAVAADYYSFTAPETGVYDITLTVDQPGINWLFYMQDGYWRNSESSRFDKQHAGLYGVSGDYNDEIPSGGGGGDYYITGLNETASLSGMYLTKGETLYLWVSVDSSLENPAATLRATSLGEAMALSVGTPKDVVMVKGESQVYYVDIPADGFYRVSYLDPQNHSSSSLSAVNGQSGVKELCGLMSKGDRFFFTFYGQAGYYTLLAEQIVPTALALNTAQKPVPAEAGDCFYYQFTASADKAYEFLVTGGAAFSVDYWWTGGGQNSSGTLKADQTEGFVLPMKKGQSVVLRLTAKGVPGEGETGFSVLAKEAPENFTAPTVQVDRVTPFKAEMTLTNAEPYSARTYYGGVNYVMGVDYCVGGLKPTDLNGVEWHSRLSSAVGSTRTGDVTLEILKPETTYTYRTFLYDPVEEVYYHGATATFTTPAAEKLTAGEPLTLTADEDCALSFQAAIQDAGRYQLKVANNAGSSAQLYYCSGIPGSWDGMAISMEWDINYLYSKDYNTIPFRAAANTLGYYYIEAYAGSSFTVTLTKLDDDTPGVPAPTELQKPEVFCMPNGPFNATLAVDSAAPDGQIYEVYVSLGTSRDNAQEQFLRVYPGGVHTSDLTFDAVPGQTYAIQAKVVAKGQTEPLVSDWLTFEMPALDAKALKAGETLTSRFNQELNAIGRYYTFTPDKAGAYELSLETVDSIGAEAECRVMEDGSWRTQIFSFGEIDSGEALTWQLAKGQTLYVYLMPNDWYGENHDYSILVTKVTPAAAFGVPDLTFEAVDDFVGFVTVSADVPLGAEFSLEFCYREKGTETWLFNGDNLDYQFGDDAGTAIKAEGWDTLYTLPGVTYELKGILTDARTGDDYESQIVTVTATDTLSAPLTLGTPTVLKADKSDKYDYRYYSFTAAEEGFYQFTVRYEDYAARMDAGYYQYFDTHNGWFTGWNWANRNDLDDNFGAACYRVHLMAGERTFLRLMPGFTQDYTLTAEKLPQNVVKLTAPDVTVDFTTDPYQANYTVSISADVPLGSWFELGLQTRSENDQMTDSFLDGAYDYLYETIAMSTKRSMRPGTTYEYRAYLYDWLTGQRYYSDWAEFTAPEVKELTLDQEVWYRVNDQLKNTYRFYRLEAKEDGFYQVQLTGNGSMSTRYMYGADWQDINSSVTLLKMEKGDVAYFRIRAAGRDDYQMLATKVTTTVTDFKNLKADVIAPAPNVAEFTMTAEVPLWSNYQTGFEYTLQGSIESVLVMADRVIESPAEGITSIVTLVDKLDGLWQGKTYSVRAFLFDLDTGKTYYSAAQTLTLDPAAKLVTLTAGKAAESRALEYTGTEGTPDTAAGLVQPNLWETTYFVFTAPEAGYYDLTLSLANGDLQRLSASGYWTRLYSGESRIYLNKDEALYLRFTPEKDNYYYNNNSYNSSYSILIRRSQSDVPAAKPVLTLVKKTDYDASVKMTASVPLEGSYSLELTYRGDFWKADEADRVLYSTSTGNSSVDRIDDTWGMQVLPGKSYTVQATLTVTGDDGKQTVFQSDPLKFTTPDDVTRTLALNTESRTVWGLDTEYDRYRFTAPEDGTYYLTASPGDSTFLEFCVNRYGDFSGESYAGASSGWWWTTKGGDGYWFNLEKGQEVYIFAVGTPDNGSMLKMVKVAEDEAPFQVDANVWLTQNEPFEVAMEAEATVPRWATFDIYLQYGTNQAEAIARNTFGRTYYNWTDGVAYGEEVSDDFIPGVTYCYRGVVKDWSTGMEWAGSWNYYTIPTEPMTALTLNEREPVDLNTLGNNDAYRFTAPTTGFYDVVLDGYEGKNFDLYLCTAKYQAPARYHYTDAEYEKGCTRVRLEAGETLFVSFGHYAIGRANNHGYMGLTIQQFKPTVTGYEPPTVTLAGEADEYFASVKFSAVVEPGKKLVYGIVLSDGTYSKEILSSSLMKQGYVVPLSESILDGFSLDLLPGRNYTVTPFIAEYKNGARVNQVNGEALSFTTAKDVTAIPLTLSGTEERYHEGSSYNYNSRYYRFTAEKAGTYRISCTGAPKGLTVYDRPGFQWVESEATRGDDLYTVRTLAQGESVYVIYTAGTVEHLKVEKLKPTVTSVGKPTIQLATNKLGEPDVTPVCGGVVAEVQAPIGEAFTLALRYYRTAEGASSAVFLESSAYTAVYDGKGFEICNPGMDSYTTCWNISESIRLEVTGIPLTPGTEYKFQAVVLDSQKNQVSASDWLTLATPTTDYTPLTIAKGQTSVTSSFSVNPDNGYERCFAFTAPERGAYTLTLTGPMGYTMRRVAEWTDDIDEEVMNEVLLQDAEDRYTSYWRAEADFGYTDATLTLYLDPSAPYYFFVQPKAVGDYSVTIEKGATLPNIATLDKSDLRVQFNPTAAGTVIIAAYDGNGKMIGCKFQEVKTLDRQDVTIPNMAGAVTVKVMTVNASNFAPETQAISITVQ